MTYKRIHLHLSVDPKPTSNAAIDYACSLAHLFEAQLSISSPRLKIKARANWLGGSMVAAMAREIEQSAAEKGTILDAYLAKKASALRVDARVTHQIEQWPPTLGDKTWYGRASDLCVLGLPRGSAEQRAVVEEWIFGVGRPCLVFPDDSAHGFLLDSVVISWDFSRSAARAVGDAIPLLRRAKQVRVATVRGEKDIPTEDAGTPLVDFLAVHGISSVVDEVTVEHKTIGRTILECATDLGANLVVMGAFGHSRSREFFLGGATKELLEKSAIPLFMSH